MLDLGGIGYKTKIDDRQYLKALKRTETGAEGTGRPIRFSGPHFPVNADVSAGELRAELLDLGGKPIAAFTGGNCVPMTEGRDRVGIAWRGAGSLAALAGGPVRLRFILPSSQCLPAEDGTTVTPFSRRIAGVPATYTLPPENAIRLP
jgi:hypothetical protein